jgi:tyrosyl-tRNA synthetase
MSVSKELEERGFINQFSAPCSEILDGQKRVIYHGIDPTADSAHAGNFVIWMLLRHLASNGHKVIFLVGGGTGMIGDPKSDTERPTADPEIVANNVKKLQAQAEKIFGDMPVEFVNNAKWLTKLNLIEFLRDIGKRFTVNELLKKEAIAARLAGENGISYTEFAYPLLQAYDYLTLHREYGCDVQVGGSDQWGNILAGVDLVRRVEGQSVYALTVPLIIDKTTGKKFGKSEGNAVWLDAEKTSAYQFYQFWLNVTDENVVDYLKLFTFLTLGKIEEIKKSFELNPSTREAQKILANEVTKLVHGEETAMAVRNVSELLFGSDNVGALSTNERQILLDNAPVTKVSVGIKVVDALVETGLATSKREARTFIESGAVVINNQKVSDVESTLQNNNFVGDLLVLKRGKKMLSVLSL